MRIFLYQYGLGGGREKWALGECPLLHSDRNKYKNKILLVFSGQDSLKGKTQ
jgi:hypothetical protein